MNRSWIFLAVIFSLLLSTLHSCMSERDESARQAGRRPNVIIILIDALRADHLRCYGYKRETSQNIDELAHEGVLFSMAMSPSSWTKPSIPSLFTSLYPSRHGVFEGSSKDSAGYITSDVLNDSLLTIAEVFRRNGYTTGAFVHNAQIKGFLGFSQGFDIYLDRTADAEEINREFLSWLNGETDEPFFVYLHYLDVHWPYSPPAGYDTIFGNFTSEIDFYTEEWKSLRDRINNGKKKLSGVDLEKMISLYDGELRYLDDNLGELFEELKKKSIYQNTLFIITADHGEEFFEHGKIGHGQSLYNELLHIPLIIKFPGSEWKGKKVNSPVELVDILPTLIDYFDWQTLESTDGSSVLELISGEQTDQSGNITYSELLHRGRYQRALIEIPNKIIETYSGKFRREFSKTLLPGISVGDRVEIKGKPGENGLFIAAKISFDSNQEDKDVEIEGTLSRTADNKDFAILCFKIVTLPGVEVKGQGGEPAVLRDLRVGMRIKVNGNVHDGSTLEVDRITIKNSDKTHYKVEGILDNLERSDKDGITASVAGIRISIDTDTEIEGNSVMGNDKGSTSSITEIEFYDMSTDPSEKDNLSQVRKEEIHKLQLWMDENLPSIEHMGQSPARDVRQLDAETIEELEAIGYIDE